MNCTSINLIFKHRCLFIYFLRLLHKIKLKLFPFIFNINSALGLNQTLTMKKILLLLLFISCNRKNDNGFEKIEIEINVDETIKKPTFYKNKYTTRENYLDTLGKFINPNKKFDYWQYATYYSGFGQAKYTILKQGGNVALRKMINERIKPEYSVGIFQGGHPSFRCNYISTIKNGKVKYLKTLEEFRDFLGKIDNLEEALLFARTYGYLLGDDRNQSEFKKKQNGYVLHLIKYNEFPTRIENVEVIISNNGFIKTKSLALFCEGEKCYEY